MYRVKLNRERLKNHVHYDWWKYLVAIILTISMWNLIGTMARPRTPADKKIDIFLVGDYILDESTDKLTHDVLKDYDNLLEVNITNIGLGEDNPQMDYMGRQKLMVMLGTQTGDLYIFDKEEFNKVAAEGVFLPLDDFVKDNKELIGDERLAKMEKVSGNEENQPHYFGIALDGNELFQGTGYEPEGKVMGIMLYSENQPMALEILKWILNDGAKI